MPFLLYRRQSQIVFRQPVCFDLKMQTVLASPPRKDHRGVKLSSDVLSFGCPWYEQAPDAIDYAKLNREATRPPHRIAPEIVFDCRMTG
jgi:hypothetical protein